MIHQCKIVFIFIFYIILLETFLSTEMTCLQNIFNELLSLMRQCVGQEKCILMKVGQSHTLK